MSKNQGLKVFSAVAIGSFVGSLIGLQLNLLWWVGMLIGGLIGYASYNFNELKQAVPVAARQTRYVMSQLAKVDYGRGFRQLGWYILVGLGMLAKLIGVIAGIVILFMVVGMIWGVEVWVFFSLVFTGYPFYNISMLLTSLLTYCLLTFVGALITMMVFEESPSYYTSDGEIAARLFFKATPLGVLAWWIPKGLWALLVRIPRMVRAGWIFSSKLFRLIHSEARLQCGVYAAIGAGVGQFMHNPLLGAGIGATLGVISYQFLTKRWLKPADDRNLVTTR